MTRLYVEKDGVLSKEEIREFIKQSLMRGRFNALFEAENQELKVLVDQLMKNFFGEVEFDSENCIDTYTYKDTIESHLSEDDTFMVPLIELFDPSTQEFVTKQEIRDGFSKVCRNQLEHFQNRKDEIDRYNEDVLEKTGGKFARLYIDRLCLAY